MKSFDINFQVEICEEAVYFFYEIICGVGGLLVGILGKGMFMLLGGIDLFVVGYFVFKCGVDIEVVYFVSLFYMSFGVFKKV